MGVLHGLSGALYIAGIFVFVDGALQSKDKYLSPYIGVDCLPPLLCFLGMLCFAMCNINKIAAPADGDDADYMAMGYGGGADEGSGACAVAVARVLFFAGTFLMLAGFGVGIWRLVVPYKHHSWSGWALVLQSVIHMLAAAALKGGERAGQPAPAMSF